MVQNQQCLRGCLDADDCLKTVRFSKRWNTLLLLLVIFCLLILQASFYIVDQGYVKITSEANGNNSTLKEGSEQASPTPGTLGKWIHLDSLSRITFKQLAFTIKLVNNILILVMILYCFTLLFSLNVSLQGKLGGAKHLSRACILSLFMLVLLWPWQKTFGSIIAGAVFTPGELAKWYSAKTEGTLNVNMYYLRFGGYGILTFLLLLLSALGSHLWAREIFSRLTESGAIMYSVHRSAPSAELSESVDAL